jgi:Tol biopolymer transport system component
LDDPVFSPDGKQIAFLWDGPNHKRQDIYTMPIGGNQPYQVTRTGPVPQSVSWSPDGQFFAYSGSLDGKGGLYIVPALGGPERKLKDYKDGESTPQWTPDGKSLLITEPCGNEPAWTLAIVLVSVATGEKRCLTAPPPQNYDMRLQLSPDGTRVAFVRAPSPRVGDYYVVPLSGGAPTRLTRGEVGFDVLMWSGDSSRIIFYSGHPAQYGNGLVSVPAQGGPVKPESTYTQIGALSPDGKRVVYADSNLHVGPSLWRIDFASPGGRVISNRKIIDSTRSDNGPDLSPDGKSLAYNSMNSGTREIWTSNSEGADPVKLTSFQGELAGSPHWSPDGRQIVFERRPGTVGQLWLMDADGSNQRPFIVTNSDNILPTWSRDGRSIYFQSLRSGDREIWKQPLSADQRSAQGPPVQVTKTGGFYGFESYDRKTVFYTRVGVDGVWNIPSTGGTPIRITDSPGDGLWGHWAVSETGLYTLNCRTSPHCTFEFYNFKTHRRNSLFQIAVNPGEGDPGFTASGDGKTLIYTLDRPSENFISMTELLP